MEDNDIITDEFINNINTRHAIIKSDAKKKMFYKRYAYFATLLYTMRWEIDFNCPDNALGYVQFDQAALDKSANGTIFLSSKLFEKDDFKYTNYIFILLHEILHIINGHGFRKGMRNHVLWNLATDHCINMFLKKLCNDEIGNNNTKNDYVAPYGGFNHLYICKELEEKKADITAEEVYDYLVKNMKDNYEVSELGDKGGGQGGGSGQNDNDTGNQQSKNSGDKSVGWCEVKDKRTGESWVVYDVKKTEKDTQKEHELQNEARTQFESAKERGTLSSFMSEYLANILKVEIPWDELLKKAIKQNIIHTLSGRGWQSIHKNYLAHGFTLPGMAYDESRTGTGRCIISVDTSGSISKDEMMEMGGIIHDAMPHFKEVQVLVHDVDVHQDFVFQADEQADFLAFLKEIGFKGRGGTSHTYVFKNIQKTVDTSDEPVSMYIGLTDCYSDIEENWKKFQWCYKNEVPTYFIITSSGRYMSTFKKVHEGADMDENPCQIMIKKKS